MLNSAEIIIYRAHTCLNVSILTFISRINDEMFKPENSFDFGYFNIYQQLKFHAQVS